MLKFVILFICVINQINSNLISDENSDDFNQIIPDDKINIIDDKLNMNSEMSVEDHVHLLTKQLNALMTRRREDYKLLENSLKKYVLKNSMEVAEIDVKEELNILR